MSKLAIWSTAGAALVGAAYSWWPAPLRITAHELQAGTSAPIAPPAVMPQGTPPASAAAPIPAAWPRAAAAPGPAAQLQVGAEGYGPVIERARDGNNAKLAWQAVNWLRNCDLNERVTKFLQRARGEGLDHAEMTRAIEAQLVEARRCQTVTSKHQALLAELSLRAMRGDIPGAAVAYAEVINFAELDASMQAEVVATIRRDAAAGDNRTLIAAAVTGDRWGLPDPERWAYQIAYFHVHEQSSFTEMVQAVGTLDIDTMPVPNAVQWAAARAAAQQIVDAANARRGPG